MANLNPFEVVYVTGVPIGVGQKVGDTEVFEMICNSLIAENEGGDDDLIATECDMEVIVRALNFYFDSIRKKK